MADYAQNYLRTLMQTPGSFSGSPGYGFALDQGLQGVNRRAAISGGGGGALAAAAKYATGLASQDYGNEFQRRLGAASLEQQGNIASDQNALGQGRLALDDRLGTGNLALGQGNLALGQTRAANDFTLGQGNLALGQTRAANDFSLGQGQNANTAQNNWLNYRLGSDRNAIQSADNENQYNLGAGRQAIDWYNAGTQRGDARSRDFATRDSAARAWMPFGPTGGQTGFADRRPGWARAY